MEAGSDGSFSTSQSALSMITRQPTSPRSAIMSIAGRSGPSSQLCTFAFTPSPETVWKRSGPSGRCIGHNSGAGRRFGRTFPPFVRRDTGTHVVTSAMNPTTAAAAKRSTTLMCVPPVPRRLLAHDGVDPVVGVVEAVGGEGRGAVAVDAVGPVGTAARPCSGALSAALLK